MCASLSCLQFFWQGAPIQLVEGHNPVTNLNFDCAGSAVRLKSEPHYWVLVICLLSVGHVRLSFVFSIFLQATLWEWLGGPNPSWNINANRADIPVCLKFDQVYWVLTMYLIESCACAPYLSSQSFFPRRSLNWNDLTGTVPQQISALTKLGVLYAQKWNILSSVSHLFDWVLVLRVSPMVSRGLLLGT